MRILFAYNTWGAASQVYAQKNIEAGKRAGFDIIPFELTPKSLAHRYLWEDLDRLWKYRKIYTIFFKRRKAINELVIMHDRLIQAAQNADVLWVYNGANFHPDWLRELPKDLLTVYGCFDDHPASDTLSMPVAPYFDACLVGNIAATPAYQGWGCRHVQWIPVFTHAEKAYLSEADFSAAPRTIPLVFCGERHSPWRQKRFDALTSAFPEGIYHGNGWKQGFYSDPVSTLYHKAKLGINIHWSTGPIDTRLFELPAHGVMQFCDNKCRLGHIFNLETEVIGYDLLSDAIEHIRYYMDHDQERQAIAWNGYRRYWNDYTPEQIWKTACRYFREWREAKKLKNLYEPKRFAEYKTIYITKNIIKNTSVSLRNAYIKFREKKNAPYLHNHYINEYYQISVSPISKPAYIPNKPTGSINLDAKLARIKEHGFFEWPNMVALNWTVASMAGSAKKIIEIGGGTGCFAYEAAADPHREILCLEADDGARNWGKQHRARPNIIYDNKNTGSIPDMSFDLLVSIDVCEHIEEYKIFFQECSRLASRAILTTPNRFRCVKSKNLLSPSYIHHVREWSAGEFYYILCMYWNKVFLYTMPDPYIPLCIPCDINTEMTPIIAVCCD